MTPDPEALRLYRAEQAADAARQLAWRREAQRASGVAWSGLAPEPPLARAAPALARDAAARLAALERWRRGRPARLLAALAEAERAVEAARACLARGLAAGDPRCATALADLQRAAAKAMDADRAGALSDARCATSIGSSNRSTGSPPSSAS